jgi:hypothetical protein
MTVSRSELGSLKRAERVTETRVEDDLFLVAVGTGEIVRLDRIGSALWAALEQPSNRADILEVFRDAFPETEPERLAGDIDAALAVLIEAGLVEETQP